MSQPIGIRSLSSSSQMVVESMEPSIVTSNGKRSSLGTLSRDPADPRTSKVAKRSIGQDVVSSDPSNTQSQFPLSSHAAEENREPRVISSMEVASNNKRSSLGTLSRDPADPRTSKVAKRLIEQDAASNDPSKTPSQSSLLKLSHSSLMQPGSASLSVLADAGSKSGPLNTVLTYLNLSDIGNLRKISKQFKAVIQSKDIPFIFKQQLEYKKAITQDDLFKYKKISGKNLSSSRIEALDVNDNDVDFIQLNDPDYSVYSLTDEEITTIFQRYPNLNTVKIESCSRLTNRSLHALAENAPRLQNLSLSNFYHLDEETLIVIAQKCQQLQSLTMTDCIDDNQGEEAIEEAEGRITDQAFMQIAQNCPRLKSLSFDWSCMVTEDALIALAEKCPDLQTFEARTFAVSLTENSLIQIAKKFTKALVIKLSPSPARFDYSSLAALTQYGFSLQTLAIKKFKLRDDDFQEIQIHRSGSRLLMNLKLLDDSNIMNDRIFGELVRNCADLENLTLKDCSNLTDQSLIEIATNCKKLRKLELRRCTGITGQGLVGVAEKFPHLEKLTLENCSTLADEHLAQIAAHCTKLRTVKLKTCPGITGQSLAVLTRNCSDLRTLSVVQFEAIADLYYNDIAIFKKGSEFVMEISDRLEIAESLFELARNSPDLETLAFTDCPTLTDEHLAQIAAHCTKLQSVKLKTCLGITGQSLAAMIRNRLDLRGLSVKQFKPMPNSLDIEISKKDSQFGMNISDHLQITDSLFEIARNSPDLETLTFIDCPTLTDEHLAQIAAHCKKLRHVRLKTCPEITGQGLVALTQNRPDLRTLSVKQFKPTTTFPDIVISKNGSEFSMGISDQLQIVDSLPELARNCPDLEMLTLENCPTLTDEHLSQITAASKSLQWVELKTCPGITGQGLAGLTQNRPDLRTLSVIQLKPTTSSNDITISMNSSQLSMSVSGRLNLNITDSLIGKNCHSLETLYLISLNQLTNQLLIDLAYTYPNLKKLDISLSQDGVQTGTIAENLEKGLVNLAEICSQLQSVKIVGCPQMDSETHQKIREAYPYLTIELIPYLTIELIP